MTTTNRADEVQVVDFTATKVAALEHRGDPRQIAGSIRNFIAWRRENRLPPRHSATFNVVYDDETAVTPQAFRFDLCAATNGAVADNRFGVVSKTIPGGRCAVLRHIGSDDTLRDTVRYLCAEWLPASGEELRDFPMFFERVEFYPEVAERDAVTVV